MSIEQLADFHLVRRVLRTVSPDFRLLANSELASGESVLDMTRKTIEVGEATPILEAVGALLFQIGHLVARKHPRLGLLYGEGIRTWKGTEGALIETLARVGVAADKIARTWADVVLAQYWDMNETDRTRILDSQTWTRKEWREYFASR